MLKTTQEVRVTYDASVDAAYIYLREIGPGEAKTTIDAGGNMMTMLDFDGEGRLVGIEVMGASRRLPASFLPGAEPEIVDVPDPPPAEFLSDDDVRKFAR